MKNKNKTIIEANKGSITKKIGRFAVIVVLYIALVSTLTFVMSTISIFVNADSVGGGNVWSNPYTYSSMYIYTDNGAYCVGSNDYFTNSTDNNISFDDYYSVLDDDIIPSVPIDLTGAKITLNENIDLSVLDSSYTWFLLNITTDYALNGSYYNFKSIRFILNTSSFTYFTNIDGGYGISVFQNGSWTNDDARSFTITGGTDVTNINLINFFYKNGTIEGGIYDEENTIINDTRAVADSPISIKRLNTATYNSSGNYYSIFSEITSPNIIGFDFNFAKDIAVTYAQLTNNEFYYNYSMTNDYSITKSYTLLYYDIDGNLTYQEITSVISYDAGDTGTLLPTLNEIEYFIGEDNIGLQDIYLIQDLYVSTNSSLVIGTDYVHIFEWLAYNPTRTKQITNDYVNNFYRTTKIDVGEILLNSVNSFLKFELIPGFSLLSLLALVIGIPLLIYILKLFLGG